MNYERKKMKREERRKERKEKKKVRVENFGSNKHIS